MKINPNSLSGPWDAGFALDLHIARSQFLGYSDAGRPLFENTRSELGERIFQLKYRNDRTAIVPIAKVVADFLRARQITPDVVLGVPPTKRRAFQPLLELAKQVAVELNIRYAGDALTKVRNTGQVKDESDLAKRAEALLDAFELRPAALTGQHVLILDDLYQSGASLSEAARTVRQAPTVQQITVIAITRARS